MGYLAYQHISREHFGVDILRTWPESALIQLHALFSLSWNSKHVRNKKPQVFTSPRSRLDVSAVIQAHSESQTRGRHWPFPPVCYFSCCCNKASLQWEVDFSSHLEDTAQLGRDDLTVGTGGKCHMTPVVRKQRETNAGAQLTSSFSFSSAHQPFRLFFPGN